MQTADEFKQIRKIDNINFIVKTFFTENDSESISDKLKAIIEKKSKKLRLNRKNS